MKLPGVETYFGGKSGSGVYQRIINEVPPIDTLIIPYAGNCGITRRIKWPQRVLVNDVDPAVYQAWATCTEPNFEAHNLDALAFLDQVLSRPDLGRVLIYADPPYPFSSRRCQRPVYRYEMGANPEHAKLLDYLTSLRASVMVMISTYPNPLYEYELGAWRREEFTAQTRKGGAVEWLFCNYPKPAVLQDDRYAGGNYREREYIKRKAGRWLKKYQDMTAPERQFVLRELLRTTPADLLAQLAPSGVPPASTVIENRQP